MPNTTAHIDQETTQTAHPEVKDLAGFFRAHPGYQRFPQEHRRGGAYGLSCIRAKQSAHDFVDPAFPELSLQIALTADLPFRWHLGDGWIQPVRFCNGAMLLAPSHTEIRYECAGPHDVLIVNCPAQRVSTLVEEYGYSGAGALLPISMRPGFHDPLIRSGLLQIWEESGRHGEASALLIDGLWQVIVARLLCLAKQKPKAKTYGLTQVHLARIDDFLSSRLHTSMNTGDLATLVGLPMAQFTRDFRDATGLSPYRYILQRRIERARSLISHGELPLLEVANQCGFASQSHMNDVFRERLGISPGLLRRQANGQPHVLGLHARNKKIRR